MPRLRGRALLRAGVIRYHITDRKQFASLDELIECLRRNDAAGVEMIQIREKDLSAKALCALVRGAVDICRHAKVLVNARVDVAMACGAAGAHLPGDSPGPLAWRGWAPPGFLFGVSCHTVEEAARAEREAADFVVFAPVFDPLSKPKTGEAQGLAKLGEAARAVRIPVLALGGITAANSGDCMAAGAAGVAGITMFQGPRGVVRT